MGTSPRGSPYTPPMSHVLSCPLGGTHTSISSQGIPPRSPARWHWAHGWVDVSAVKPRCPHGPERWHATSPARGARLTTLLLASDLHHRACWLGAGNEVFVKLIKTTEARRKGKLISHGNQLDLIQKNKQRVRSVSLAGCFSGKGITRRFPPKGMALCCCSLCNWGFRSGTKSHYHKISLSEKKS